MFQMVIANRVQDGLVVYRADGGRWVTAIADGQVAADETEAAALLADATGDAHERQVIDPYLIEITDSGDNRRPVAIREAIRALGPTIIVEAG